MTGNWDAIVRAAGRRSRKRRVVTLAVAVAALAIGVSPVGGAIADGVADFSAGCADTRERLLTATSRQAFEQANQRRWSGFPADRAAEADLDDRRRARG